MYKILPLFIIACACLMACGKEAQVPLSKQQIQQRIDSITAMRLRDIEERAQRDLAYRLKIEARVNTDSLPALIGRQPMQPIPQNTDTTGSK